MSEINEIIIKRLYELQDNGYRDFIKNLSPTVQYENIIGVRMPVLRKFSKEIAKDEVIDEFLSALPHRYYEENNVHGSVIAGIKDFDRCIEEVERFLPYIDNWATCDMMSPKVFAKNREKLLPHIFNWLGSEHTYTIRFGIEMLMSHYLDEAFDLKYPNLVAGIRSDEYYVNMMIAWYFATALAKQYDSILPFIEERKLDEWTHNKTIQKAVESYRITDEQKAFLKTLRVKTLRKKG